MWLSYLFFERQRLDSNYLTSAKHAPKKWNVNYISISGLTAEELVSWNGKYGDDWSSVDSELHKELSIVTEMLNMLESFGYQLLSTMTSNPRVAYKDTENNRECYIWTLHKSLDVAPAIPTRLPPTRESSFYECGNSTSGSIKTTEFSLLEASGTEKRPPQNVSQKNSSSDLPIFEHIESIFRTMTIKEQQNRTGTKIRNLNEEIHLSDYQGDQVSQI